MRMDSSRGLPLRIDELAAGLAPSQYPRSIVASLNSIVQASLSEKQASTSNGAGRNHRSVFEFVPLRPKFVHRNGTGDLRNISLGL